MSRYFDGYRDPARWAEHRGWVAYDEADPSSLIFPDGSLLCSGDRAFMTVCAPLVYALHLAARGQV